MQRALTLLLLLSFPATLPLQAQEADAAAADAIRERIAELSPESQVGAIEPSPIEGVYSVMIGADVVYLSGDGRYLLQGEFVDLEARRSLSEDKRAAARLERLNALGEERLLIYEPRGDARHEITVVTDIDCPYCRQMHAQMDEYNAAGIRVRYLLMPRAGKESDSYDKAVSVWCADDPRLAMTRAKAGKSIDRRTCDNPVDEHMALAREFGIRATPTIITDRGRTLSGYRPPDALAEALERDSRSRTPVDP